jgi:hypothetical protein
MVRSTPENEKQLLYAEMAENFAVSILVLFVIYWNLFVGLFAYLFQTHRERKTITLRRNG